MFDLHLFRMTLFKWLDVTGIVFWIGAIGFRLLVFLPSLKSVRDRSAEERLRRDAADYTEPALKGLLIYLLVLHFLTWVHEAEMMSGKPLSAIAPILPIVLTKTHFGMIWAIKLFLLLLFSILVRIRFRVRDPLLFGGGLFFCLMGSLVGHPVTHPALHGVVFADWIHYAAVSVWIGGLLPLRRLSRKAASWMDPASLASYLRSLISAFSKVATISVVLIIVSGTYNAYLLLDGHWIFDVNYGRVLVAKLLFVGATIGMGGLSRFYILPSLYRVKRSGPLTSSDLERRFAGFLMIELTFAIITLLLAALLSQTPPPSPPLQ